MQNNPFEPPGTELREQEAGRSAPIIVTAFALAGIGVMVVSVALALLFRPLSEAIVVVFFSAFMWFVPFGMLRGRPWAPAAGAAAGVFVALFAFVSIALAGADIDAFAFYSRLAVGIFALCLAVVLVRCREDPWFGIQIPIRRVLDAEKERRE